MAISLPGNVSILWALIYMAAGMYLVPLVLSLISGLGGKKKETAA